MKKYIRSTSVVRPTYICQLPDSVQRNIRFQLRRYGLRGKDLEDAMNSKISDITGNPEMPISIDNV
jgi:hypothetical protein